MANIYINNNLISVDTSISFVSNVKFNSLTSKVYSATKIDRAYGVFISNVLLPNEYFVRWNNLSWIGATDTNSSVYLYIKSSENENELLNTDWVGPYNNSINDISWATGKCLQFMAVLRNDTSTSFPVINSINVSYLSLNNPVKFFTNTFNLGFVPKHLLLTYNAQNETDDTILKFAISGKDTANIKDYIYIDPNKIENLDHLGFYSDQIKVMIELGGVSGTNISVDEFAINISSENAIRLNQIYDSSSS